MNAIFVLALVQGLPIDSRIPVERLTARSFLVTGHSPRRAMPKQNGARATFVRESDRAKLAVSLAFGDYAVGSGLVRDSPMRPNGAIGGVDQRDWPDMAMPMGTDHEGSLGPIGGYLWITTRYEFVSVSLIPPRSSAGGHVRHLAHDWTHDRSLIETLARVSLARTAGYRLGSPGYAEVGGASIPTRKCGRSSAIFGEVNAWANRRGWSVEENTEFGYFTLKKGARYVVLPLGSPKVKVDGVWRDGGDVVALRDGKLYATKRAIEAIE